MNINLQLGSLLTSSITSSQAITYKEDLNALQVVEADHKSKVDAKAVEVLNGIFKTQSFKQLKLHQQVILCDNLWKVKNNTRFAFDPRQTTGALLGEDWDLESLKEINAFSKKHKMALFVDRMPVLVSEKAIWFREAIVAVYAKTIKNAMTQQTNASQFETRTVCYSLLADLKTHYEVSDPYEVGVFLRNAQQTLGKDICGTLMQHVSEHRVLLEQRIANLVNPDFSLLTEEGLGMQVRILYDSARSGSNCLDRMMPIVASSHGFGIVRQFIYTRAMIEADRHQLELERTLQIMADQIEPDKLLESEPFVFQILEAVSENAIPSEIIERVPFLTNFLVTSLTAIVEDYLGLDCVFRALLQVSFQKRYMSNLNCEMLGKLLQNSTISQVSKLHVLHFVDMYDLEKPILNAWAIEMTENISRKSFTKAELIKKPAWHFATEMLKYFEANPSPTRKTDSLVKLLRG